MADRPPGLAASVRSRGCVLTVGSTAWLTGSLTNPRTAHSSAKGAVIALTRQHAAEGAPHSIRANCISPGMIDTDGSRSEAPTSSSVAVGPQSCPRHHIKESRT
ncbi:SDR family oxidoreductase [Streptomyces sp. NPDC048438]|uniref:SDR family oxidoreductase n=1 Tax=Streptomyces sp. NPDC048438 TaxID=3365551 RepID=UPI00371F5B9B